MSKIIGAEPDVTQLARQAVVAVWSGAGIYHMTDPAKLEVLFSGSILAQRATCDWAVASLLSIDSLVEPERSDFLIERPDCSISGSVAKF